MKNLALVRFNDDFGGPPCIYTYCLNFWVPSEERHVFPQKVIGGNWRLKTRQQKF